jgi:hypothetical protein
MRRVLLACAFALAGAMAVQLAAETRHALRAAEPVARTLARGAEAGGGVFFVFQPQDCLASGEMVERWNALYEARSFAVQGLVVGDGTLSDRQERMFRDRKVRMPVRGISARDAALVAEKLGYHATPFAVVLDRQGRVAGSFPAGQNVPATIIERLIQGS